MFRQFRPITPLLAVFLCLSFVLSSCVTRVQLSVEEERLRFGAEQNEGNLVPGQAFRLVIPSAPLHLDPQLRLKLHEKGILEQLFEGLTAYSTHGRVKLQQAEKITSDDTFITWQIQLRQDLKWSDGSSVLPSDYQRTWLSGLGKRALQESLCDDLGLDAKDMPFYQVAPSGFFAGAKDLVRTLKPLAKQVIQTQSWLEGFNRADSWNGLGAETISLLKAAETAFLAKDDVQVALQNFAAIKSDDAQGTLTIQLDAALPSFEEWLSDSFFYPQKIVNRQVLFNSAFVWERPDFQSPSFFVLQKNARYWDAANVHLNELSFTVEEQPVVAYENYRNQLYDYFGEPFYSVPKERREEAMAQPETLIFPSTRLGYFRVDSKFPLFRQPEERQAFYELLDAPFLSAAVLLDSSPVFPSRPSPTSALREQANNVLQSRFSEAVLGPVNEGGVVGLGGPEQTDYRLLVAGTKEWLGALRLRLLLRRQAKPEEPVHVVYQTLWLPTSLQKISRGDEHIGDEETLAWHWLTYLKAAGYPISLPESAGEMSVNLKSWLENLPRSQGIFPLHRRQSLVLIQPGTQGIYLSPSGQLVLRDVVLFP